MRLRLTRRTALAALAATALAGPVAATSPADGGRPPLQAQQGRWFRWAVPAGWTAHETANGVDLVAPGGRTFVSSALLHGGFGQTTPREFLLATMRQVNPSARITDASPLPAQPGLWGPWNAEDFGLTAQAQGTPVKMRATVGLSSGFGRYSATMTLYQAPASSWERDRLWLPAVAQSIVVWNARELAGQDRVLLPRNNPLDNSGLIESWRRKGLSEDRISQGRREGTMGYKRLEDPTTGRRYEMPIENYDGTVGGWRNPLRPGEILRPLPPGS